MSHTRQLGIETTIVMPGPFTKGTEHFPNAGRASDLKVAQAYSALDPMVSRNQEATESLFRPGVDADPIAVAKEISRILALPVGSKPSRSVADFTNSGVEEVNAVLRKEQESFVSRLGFGQLLELRH